MTMLSNTSASPCLPLRFSANVGQPTSHWSRALHVSASNASLAARHRVVAQSGRDEGGTFELFEGFEVKVKDATWLEKGAAKKVPGKPKKQAAAPPAPKQTGWVLVRVTKAGRGGKTVTVVTGLPPDPSQLQSTLKKLKSNLGTGGAVKNGTIEIQGDLGNKVVDLLSASGHKAKLA